MTTKNGTGWCVEAYDRTTGWRCTTRVFKTQEEAVKALESWVVVGMELRVYEVLGEKA